MAILALIFVTSDDLICEWLDGNYWLYELPFFSYFKNGTVKKIAVNP